jgi:4-amino-4-deoxy-L-arabinose transferase-like glycosyltransferase
MIGEAVRRLPPAGRLTASTQPGLGFLSPQRFPWPVLLPALLVAGPAVVALALTRFDGLYGQDSFAYFQYATGPLRQTLAHLQAPPPFFWPPGYPLLVAAISAVVGTVPLAGQIVSITAGAAVPAFTVLLAAELGNAGNSKPSSDPWPAVPLLAGLVVAVTGQLLQSSLVVMADTLGLASATAATWALVKYRRTGAVRWLAISAGAFAFAVITRWIYGLVALPFAVWSLVMLARRPWRLALLHGAVAASVAAVILGPVLVPAIAGIIAGGNAPFGGDLQVYSWNPLNALRRVFMTGDGELRYSLPNGLYYAIAPGFWWFWSPPLAILAVAGLWAVLRRRATPLGILLVAWVAIVYAFHAGAPWQNPRFALAYLPPLAILAALGFARLRAAAPDRIRRAPIILLAGGLALAAAGSVVLTNEFIERKQHDVAMVQWTERLAPANAQLLTFGLTATFQQYGRLKTRDLSELRASSLARLLSDGRPTLVLLDVAGVERQWRGLPAWENYHALLDGPGLAALAVRDGYSLFVVKPSRP